MTVLLVLHDRHSVCVDLLVERNVGEVMVQVSVAGLIGSHMHHHVSESGIICQLIVLSRLFFGLHVGPDRQVTFVNLFQEDCVGVHSLFLQVAYISVAARGCEQVHEEVEVEEDGLTSSNDQSVQNARIPHLKEEEEVHALVLRLLQQVMDPSVVTLQRAQATQMPLHATNHAWDTSDCLQEDDSVEPATLVEFVWVVTRDKIKRPACGYDQEMCNAVTDALSRLVRILYLLYFLLGVYRVSHAIALWVENKLVLDHLIQKTFNHLCNFLSSRDCELL